MLPVRCYTCGKVIGNLSKAHEEYILSGNDNWQLFFDKHKIQRYCCKRTIMTNVSDPNQHMSYHLSSSIILSDEFYTNNLFIAR